MLRTKLPPDSVFKTKIWFWTSIAFFVIVNAIFLYNQFYIGLLLPILLMGVFIGIFSFDKLIFLTILFTPFSVRYEDVIGGIGLDIPTDPLLMILSTAIIYKLFSEKMYDVKVAGISTMKYGGKMVTRQTKKGIFSGRKSAFKKAIITLQEGQTIDFYANI